MPCCHLLCFQIRVYDQDMLKSDDDLGFAMVPLSTLGVEPVDMEVPLKGECFYLLHSVK